MNDGTTWRAHDRVFAQLFEQARPVVADPANVLWPLRRACDAAVSALSSAEKRAVVAEHVVSSVSAVTRHLSATRTGLSVTRDRGYCITEQDGSTVHCAPTLDALAAWCRTQTPIHQDTPSGGFRDLMARQ